MPCLEVEEKDKGEEEGIGLKKEEDKWEDEGGEEGGNRGKNKEEKYIFWTNVYVYLSVWSQL